MKCTLVKSEINDEDNYVITIRRQDGSLVKILVPREDSPDEYVRRCMEHSMVIHGFNLVTEGHYT